MKNKILFVLTFMIATSVISAQSVKYSKAKIDLSTHSLTELARLGVEADHGEIKLGKYIINDYSEQEIRTIRQAGFDVEILIGDVVTYYEEQKVNFSLFSHSKDHSNRNEICEHTDKELIRFDYKTPEHYQYGSMGGYLTFDELMVVLDSMYILYPNLISEKAAISTIKSIEGRDLVYLKISNNPNIDEDEPEVLYTALHHAREPNSLSQMIFYMWYLLENYDTDPEIKYIVDHTALYFVPCVNPDGYVYNETTNPNGGGLWRKNRRLNSNGSYGVDLNRNYGYKWGDDNSGSSPNENSQTYRGTDPFSEPELQAIKEFCENHDFKITLNCHTHGNLLIHPWGFSDMPTDEHDSFKAIGNEMIRENNFLFGTGSETVNYTVNGDSDDWMYGDRGSFAMTPEVGPSMYGFWPPRSAIDSLNKTAVYTNLVAAKAVHAFVNHTDISENNIITQANNQLKLKLSNIGLDTANLDISISEITGFTNFSPFHSTLNLDHLELDTLILDYEVLDQNQSNLKFEVVKTINGFNSIDTITKAIDNTVFGNSIINIITDNMDDLTNWSTEGDWGLSTTEYFSAPTSLTDSPDGDYSANTTNTINFLDPIDLSNAEFANLKFKSKWNLEKSFDYVQVSISTNQVEYVPQCGNYTNLGSINQDVNTSLYDGEQTDWVQEEISLSDYLGQIIYLKISLISDVALQEDGFYIDDLEINIIEESTNTINNTYIDLKISPNPVHDILRLDFLNTSISKSLSINIYDITGKSILNKIIKTNKDQNIDISELAPGIYFITDLDKSFHRIKFIKI